MADEDTFSDLLVAIQEWDGEEKGTQNAKNLRSTPTSLKSNTISATVVKTDPGNNLKTVGNVVNKNAKNVGKPTPPAKKPNAGNPSAPKVNTSTPQKKSDHIESSSEANLSTNPYPATTEQNSSLDHQLLLNLQTQIKTEPLYEGYGISTSASTQPEVSQSLCVISSVSSCSPSALTSPPSGQTDTTLPSQPHSVMSSVSIKLEPLDSLPFTNETSITPKASTKPSVKSQDPPPTPTASTSGQTQSWEKNLDAVIQAVASGKSVESKKSSVSSRTRMSDKKTSLKGPKCKQSSEDLVDDSDIGSLTSLVPLLKKLSDSTIALYTDAQPNKGNIAARKTKSLLKVDGVDIELDCPGPSLSVENVPNTSGTPKSTVKKCKEPVKKPQPAKTTKTAAKKPEPIKVKGNANTVSTVKKEPAPASVKQEISENKGHKDPNTEAGGEGLKKVMKDKKGGKIDTVDDKNFSSVGSSKISAQKTITKKRNQEEENTESGKKSKDGDKSDESKLPNGNETDSQNLSNPMDNTKGLKIGSKDDAEPKNHGGKQEPKTMMEMNVDSYVSEANQLISKKPNKLNFTVPRLKESAKKENQGQGGEDESSKQSSKATKKTASTIKVKHEPIDESFSNKVAQGRSRSGSCDTIGSTEVQGETTVKQNILSYEELDKSTKLWKVKEKLRQVGALMELCVQGIDKQDLGQIVSIVALFAADFEVYARGSPDENITMFISCFELDIVKNLLLQLYALCLTKRSLTIGFKHVGVYPAIQITVRVNMPQGLSVFDDTMKNTDLSSYEAAFAANLQQVPAMCYPYVLLGSQHCKLQQLRKQSHEATVEKELRFFFSSEDTLNSFLSFYESIRVNGRQLKVVYKGVKRTESHVEINKIPCYRKPAGLIFSAAKDLLSPESNSTTRYSGIFFPGNVCKVTDDVPVSVQAIPKADNSLKTFNKSSSAPVSQSDKSDTREGTAKKTPMPLKEAPSNKTSLVGVKQEGNSDLMDEAKDISQAPEQEVSEALPLPNKDLPLVVVSQGPSSGANLSTPPPPVMTPGLPGSAVNQCPGSINQGPFDMNKNMPPVMVPPPIVNQGPKTINQGPYEINQNMPPRMVPPPIMNQGPNMNQGLNAMNQGPPEMNQNMPPRMVPPSVINQDLFKSLAQSILNNSGPLTIPPSMMNQGQGPMMNRPPHPMMNQGPPPGMINQGPPPGMINQGPPPGMMNRPPHPMMNQGPPGMMNQGPPPRMMNQGPPPRMMNQGPPPGMMNQGPPPGMMNQGPQPPMMNPGFSQGPPPWMNIGGSLQPMNPRPPNMNIQFPPLSQPSNSTLKDLEQETWEVKMQKFTESLTNQPEKPNAVDATTGNKLKAKDNFQRERPNLTSPTSRPRRSLSPKSRPRRSPSPQSRNRRSPFPRGRKRSPSPYRHRRPRKSPSSQRSRRSFSPSGKSKRSLSPRGRSQKSRSPRGRRSPSVRSKSSSSDESDYRRRKWSPQQDRLSHSPPSRTGSWRPRDSGRDRFSRSSIVSAPQEKEISPRDRSWSRSRSRSWSPYRLPVQVNRQKSPQSLKHARKSPVRKEFTSPKRSKSPSAKSRSFGIKNTSTSLERESKSHQTKSQGKLSQALEKEKTMITIVNTNFTNDIKVEPEADGNQSKEVHSADKEVSKSKLIKKKSEKVKKKKSSKEGVLTQIGGSILVKEDLSSSQVKLGPGAEKTKNEKQQHKSLSSNEATPLGSKKDDQRPDFDKVSSSIPVMAAESVDSGLKDDDVEVDSTLLAVFENVFSSKSKKASKKKEKIHKKKSKKQGDSSFTWSKDNELLKEEDEKSKSSSEIVPKSNLNLVKVKKLSKEKEITEQSVAVPTKKREKTLEEPGYQEHSKVDKVSGDKLLKTEKRSLTHTKESKNSVAQNLEFSKEKGASSTTGSFISEPSRSLEMPKLPDRSEILSKESKRSRSPGSQSPRDYLIDLKRSRGSSLLRKTSAVGRSVSPTSAIYDRFRNRSRSPDALPQPIKHCEAPISNPSVKNIIPKTLSPNQALLRQRQSTSPDPKKTQHHTSRVQRSVRSPPRPTHGRQFLRPDDSHVFSVKEDNGNTSKADSVHERPESDRHAKKRERQRGKDEVRLTSSKSPEHSSSKRSKVEEVKLDSLPGKGFQSTFIHHSGDASSVTTVDTLKDLHKTEEPEPTKIPPVASSFQQKIMDALARKLGMAESSKQLAMPVQSMSPVTPLTKPAENTTLSLNTPVDQIMTLLSQKSKPEDKGNTSKQQTLDSKLPQSRKDKTPDEPLTPTATKKSAQTKPKAQKPIIPASNDDIIEMIRRLQKEVKRP